MPRKTKKGGGPLGDLAVSGATKGVQWAVKNPDKARAALALVGAPLVGLTHYGYYKAANALKKKVTGKGGGRRRK